MKTILFILVIILGFVLMFMWFLLSESTRINNDIKRESWIITQEKTELNQLIKAQTTEIRELKQFNQNWENSLEYSCGSEQGEIRRLKELNTECIQGFSQCLDLIK